MFVKYFLAKDHLYETRRKVRTIEREILDIKDLLALDLRAKFYLNSKVIKISAASNNEISNY